MQDTLLTITEQAKIKILDILAEENNPNTKLRIFVQGGGCAGFSYGFSLDDDMQEEDFKVENNGVSLLVDSMSAQYLEGATVDYKQDLMGSSFTISNPNATTTCGCGTSFSV